MNTVEQARAFEMSVSGLPPRLDSELVVILRGEVEAAVNVTEDVPDFVVSAWLVAVTVAFVVTVTLGA